MTKWDKDKWDKYFKLSQEWETFYCNREYKRIRFGEECLEVETLGDRCICGVLEGEFHLLGCQEEQCPGCSRRYVDCKEEIEDETRNDAGAS